MTDAVLKRNQYKLFIFPNLKLGKPGEKIWHLVVQTSEGYTHDSELFESSKAAEDHGVLSTKDRIIISVDSDAAKPVIENVEAIIAYEPPSDEAGIKVVNNFLAGMGEQTSELEDARAYVATVFAHALHQRDMRSYQDGKAIDSAMTQVTTALETIEKLPKFL